MAVEGGARIRLMVMDWQGVDDKSWMVKESLPLKKLMEAYCTSSGLKASQVRFLVAGVCIAPDDTAEGLGLGDGNLFFFEAAT